MKSRISAVWNFLSHYKYLIVVVAGIAIVGFIDENSFMRRMQYDALISNLKADIARYEEQNAEDSRRLKELNSNPKAIERIARERYFMKADDEDIFVFSTNE